MCGIVGYIGEKEAYPIVMKGLKRLEYRGYDSSGIALINKKKIKVYKKAGRVSFLKEFTKNKETSSNIGIGHTRWATHGEVNDINAHPHLSNSKNISIIHNGIIENYHDLKKNLQQKGYLFYCKTDTEVLVILIEDIKKNNGCSIFEATRIALNKIVGSCAIVLISEDEPNVLIAARLGSPLAIGIGENEIFVASDITPMIEYTNKIIFLENKEIALIEKDHISIKTFSNSKVKLKISNINEDPESIEMGDYSHFMIKEIYEQGQSIQNCLNGRIDVNTNKILLPELDKHIDLFLNTKRIIILSCGSSTHAALYGKYIIEEIARVSVNVENASEFRYRNPVLNKGDIVFAISQSGETADTLAALELVSKQNIISFSITNVKNSSITRIVIESIFTNCGPEISVASTKAFITQLVTINLFCLWLTQKKFNNHSDEVSVLIKELFLLPKRISEIFNSTEEIKKIAKFLAGFNHAFFLGRWVNYPIALEGALKLKEVSYIHAEGYPAADMKHGPLALIDENFPIVYIAPKDKVYEKNISSIEEIKARKGKIISIISGNSSEIKNISDYHITVPETHEVLMPIVNTVPLQLLAYHAAVIKNCDVDMPKNLAKSVTVE